MPINDDLEGYDPHAAVLEMQRANGKLRDYVEQLRDKNNAQRMMIEDIQSERDHLRAENKRLRGERDRALAKLSFAADAMYAAVYTLPDMPESVRVELRDAWMRIRAAAPPEREPAPSEPEALREARAIMQRILSVFVPADGLRKLREDTHAWLARHPGPKPVKTRQ